MLTCFPEILLEIIWAFKVSFRHQYGLITLTPMVEVAGMKMILLLLMLTLVAHTEMNPNPFSVQQALTASNKAGVTYAKETRFSVTKCVTGKPVTDGEST